jgi:hypothetical protein
MKDYLGGRKEDAWTSPLINGSSWWSGVERVVDEVLVGVASVEMMAGDTLACCRKIKVSIFRCHEQERADLTQKTYMGLVTFVYEINFHAEPCIGPSIMLAEGEVSKMMIQWALERF